MKIILTVLTTAAVVTAATAALSRSGSLDSVVAAAIVGNTSTEVRPAYLSGPAPGYIVYAGYEAALPAPSCYWTREPVYDADHKVVGWRGRPLAVCP